MPAAARCPSAEDRAALYRETCVRLVDFVRAFWSVVEPSAPFLDGWHIGAVCEYLEAWYRREFQYGVLNIAPGTGKSLLVDVMFPAWVWKDKPGRKFLNCAFDVGLCLRDADKVRAIVQDGTYREAWPQTQLNPLKRARGEMWTVAGGYRVSTSPAGKGGMGKHFHDVSVNDPVKPQDVLDGKISDVLVGLEQTERWMTGTLPGRRADPATFGIMLTMQRLLEKDPAGVRIDQGWASLVLPMRYEPNATWIRGHWSRELDPRTLPGELMHPARHTHESVADQEKQWGQHASAQLQQNPIPRTGGLLEEQHLSREWIEPPKHGYWIQCWDFAARGTEATHSAVHGALWCSAECETWYELTNTIADRDRGEEPTRVLVRGPRQTCYFLMDEVWGIWTVPESERKFETTQEMPTWAAAASRIIEAKAAGIGILQRFEKKFTGVVAFHEINDECKALAQANKLDRHRANLPEYHAGRVLLPPWRRTVPDPIDGRDGPGPDAFRRELLAFPRGARDDRVDTSSMALARLTQGVSVYYAAVRELAKQARSDEEWE
jgi:phage terminase large subunit-like protein